MDELNFTRSLFKYTMSKKSILSVVLNIVILFIMALLFTLIQNAYQINTIYSFSFALIFGLIFWILFYLIIGLVCETSKEKEIIGIKILLYDVINHKMPLYHDADKLAKSIIRIYNQKEW